MINDITELNFPPYATLTQATVSLADMGEKTITAQIKIHGSVIPDFTYDWKVKFAGETYVCPRKTTGGEKTSDSALATYDVEFQHEAIRDLKRFYFVEMASVTSGTAIADKWITPLSLNLGNFVTAFRNALRYWCGNDIDIQLNPSLEYDPTPSLMEISYSYLWDVLLKMYDVYGVRWSIVHGDDAGGAKYIIKVGYAAEELSHIFKYGFEGGLLKFADQPSGDVRNIILGRGGEKNIPYRYFKDTDPDNATFAADPDWIPELANIYMDRLHDINFRLYVQGWKDKSAGAAKRYPNQSDATASLRYDYEPWPYTKGYTDEKFNPVEYVKDDESIAEYGECWGALADNDDIYPTIQGVTIDGIGRVDEAVDVEQITSDDVADATEADCVIYDVDGTESTRTIATSEIGTVVEIEATGGEIYIPQERVGIIEFATSLSGMYRKRGIFATLPLQPIDEMYFEEISATATLTSLATGEEVSPSNIPPGTYRYKVSVKARLNDGAWKPDVPSAWLTSYMTLSVSQVKVLHREDTASRWGDTFDIWIKNIWESTKLPAETTEEFASRIWTPILGGHIDNDAKVVFSSGWLSTSEDYEFNIVDYAYDDSKSIGGVQSMWRLTLAKSDADLDSLGLYVPSTKRQGNAGDYFFFTGIDLPHQYVIWSEKKLNDVKSGELSSSKKPQPSYSVEVDRVRIRETNSFAFADNLSAKLVPGAVVKVADRRFISYKDSEGNMTEGLPEAVYVSSVTYTYHESDSKFKLPTVQVELSNEVVTGGSSVEAMQGDIEQLRKNYANIGNVEAIIRVVGDKLYLRKDGVADKSLSPTQFYGLLSSTDFRQGRIGGAGWGIFRDGNGDAVLEIDRMSVRNALEVSSIEVHQTEYVGGSYIESAAAITVSNVETNADGGVKCYFDQKQGSVKNHFKVNDIAYAKTYDEDNVELNYYKRIVTAVGEGYIVIASEGAGEGAPTVGDVIIQYGNTNDKNRQYVKIRDVVGGGYERFIEGLDSVTAQGTEYYFAGKAIGSNGQLASYRLFIGNKDADYLEWKDGELNLKGKLTIRGTGKTVEDYVDGKIAAEEELRQSEIDALQRQIDGVVEAWSGEGEPTTESYPASSWTTDIERQKHIGDVYTDNETGYAYRWYWNTASDFGWTQIGDTAAAEALNLAKQSVTNVDVLYQATTSQDTAPALPPASGWQTDAPQWQSGYYIWTTTKTTYGDERSTYSAPTMISGKDGADGTNVTITSQSVTYQTSASGITPPTGTWQTAVQATTDSKPFLWTRTVVMYSSGENTTSYSVSYKGKDGTSPYIIDLTDEVVNIPCSSDGAPSISLSTVTTKIFVYEGNAAAAGWTLTKSESGCTSTLGASTSSTSGVTLTLNTLTADTATVTVTATKSGKTMTTTWKISKVKAGATGAAGASQHYNLFTGTGAYREDTPLVRTTTNVDGYVVHQNIKAFVDGAKTVTIQCKTDATWAQNHATAIAAQDTNAAVLFLIGSATTSYQWDAFRELNASNMKSNGVWTVTLPDGCKSWYLRTNIYSDGTTEVTHRFWDIKMEEGETASDWCMAEEEYNAVVYSIVPSVDSITKAADGTLSAPSVTATRYKTVGSSRATTTEKFFTFRRAGQDLSDMPISGATAAIALTSSTTAVELSLYEDSTKAVLIDRERIPVVQDGVTITSRDTRYVTTTVNSKPSDTVFDTASTTFPTNVALGDYLWIRTIVAYSDGESAKTYSVTRIGKDGDQGIDGINSYLHIAYANSADGTVDFSTTDGTNKKYIGQYVDENLSDSTAPSKYTWTLFRGADARSIYLRGTQFSNNGNAVLGIDGTDVYSFGGGRGLYVFIIDRETLSVNSYSLFDVFASEDDCGSFVNLINSQTEDVFIAIASRDAIRMTAAMNEALNACGGIFSEVYAPARRAFAFIGYKGLKQGYAQWVIDKNVGTDTSSYAEVSAYVARGMFTTAQTNVTIASITEEYYLSTSPTTLTGGEWKTDRPQWVAGMYYWTRSKITYTDGTVEYTAAVCVSGDGAYTHYAYANSADGVLDFSTTDSSGRVYLGQYSDNKTSASTSPSAYRWRLAVALAQRANLLYGTEFDANNMGEWYYVNANATIDTIHGQTGIGLNVEDLDPNTGTQSVAFLEQDVMTTDDADNAAKHNFLKPATWYTCSFYALGDGQVWWQIPSSVVDTSVGKVVDGVWGTTGTDAWTPFAVSSLGAWVFHSVTFKTKATLPSDERQWVAWRIKKGGVCAVSRPKLEECIVATEWQRHESELDYVTRALRQDTTVEGGLIQTSLIKLGEKVGSTYVVNAGSNGLVANNKPGGGIAFWAGGDFIDPKENASSAAAFGVRMDGSAWAAQNTLRFEENQIFVGNNIILDDSGLHLVDSEGEKMQVGAVTVNPDEALVDKKSGSLVVSYAKKYEAVVQNYSTTTNKAINFNNATIQTFTLAGVSSAKTQFAIKDVCVYVGVSELASKMSNNGMSIENAYLPSLRLELLDSSNNVVWHAGAFPSLSGTTMISYAFANRTYLITSAGTYKARIRFQDVPVSGSPTLSTTCEAYGGGGGSYTLSPQNSTKTIIGNNGFISAWPNNTILAVVDGQVVMRAGNYGIKVTSAGIKKMTSGTWTNWSL